MALYPRFLRCLVGLSCLLVIVVTAGCGQQGDPPVQTTAEEIDQFLTAHPEENYTSDQLVGEASAADEEADGDGGDEE